MRNLWISVGGGVALLLVFFVAAFTTVDAGLEEGHGEPFWGKSESAVQASDTFKRAGCYACHSYMGQQSQVTGPELEGVGLRLDKESIKYFIINGTDIMPAYKDKLSESDIDNLASWLSSFQAEYRR